jgi:hypothetical protein
MVCEQKKRNENVSNLQLLETSYRTEEHCRSMDTGSMPPTHLYYPPKEAEQSQASQAAFDTHTDRYLPIEEQITSERRYM